MSEWVKKSEKLEKVGWRTVVHKVFKMPDGKIHDFTIYDRPNTHYCGIIALTKDHKVIVVRQYRPGPEKFMDEIMGGGMDEDDTDLAAAAIREMKEESGYYPGNVKDLGLVYKDAYNNAVWHYFLALNCEPSDEGQKLGEAEFAEVKLITIDELFENARSGNMTDVEAVFLAYDELMKIQGGQNAKN